MLLKVSSRHSSSALNMPSEFKSIAVAGAQGSVGKPTILALASLPGTSVIALTRRAATRPEWLPQGVTHAVIDFDDVEGTADVLREHKVEVLISAVSHEAVMAEIPLANAAKAAGVRLFVPSEYGTITMGWREEDIPPFLAPKIKVAGRYIPDCLVVQVLAKYMCQTTSNPSDYRPFASS